MKARPNIGWYSSRATKSHPALAHYTTAWYSLRDS